MKKNVLKEVPILKSENGTLTGGFSSLSTEQMRKLKGGGNTRCHNTKDCTMGTHNGCTNSGTCFIDNSIEVSS